MEQLNNSHQKKMQGVIKMDKIFSGVLQTIIAGAIIWAATEINKIDTKVAAMEERTKQMEDIRPAMNSLQLSEEEIKERLIRVEDNQHHYPLSPQKK